MRNMLVLATALVLAAAAPVPTASASETPIVGDGGGGEFRLDSSPGQYVAGLVGRAGAWIDQVALLCAPVSADGRRGAITPSLGYGGQGGSPASAICAGDGVGKRLFVVQVAGGDHPRYVDNIKISCATQPPSDACFSAGGCGVSYVHDVPYHSLDCPPGELATGIRGRASNYLNAIGLVCGPGPTPPQVVGPLPNVPGSWQGSCRGGSLQGMLLTSNCRAIDGREVTTSLDLRTCGQPASAGNENGTLVCESGARNPPVGGSWALSCENEQLSGTVLHATCRDIAGNPVVASLDLLACGQPATAGNQNGVLVCESGARNPPVGGSWAMSCENERLSGTMLTASCRDFGGNPIVTSLDLLTCGQPATAGNQNGVLVCESGRRVVPIGGSWALSCENDQIAGNVLSAVCRDIAGNQVNTSLDLQSCVQPATAGNQNGILVCESGVR